jgi:hypothetical protein
VAISVLVLDNFSAGRPHRLTRDAGGSSNTSVDRQRRHISGKRRSTWCSASREGATLVLAAYKNNATAVGVDLADTV